MKEYEGHRSWNAWNVSLWLDNTESLYNLAVNSFKETAIHKRYNKPRSKDSHIRTAINRMMLALGGERTPDGAVYNRRSVTDYMEGMYEALYELL